MPFDPRRAASAREPSRASAPHIDNDPQRVMRAFLATLARLARTARREAAR